MLFFGTLPIDTIPQGMRPCTDSRARRLRPLPQMCLISLPDYMAAVRLARLQVVRGCHYATRQNCKTKLLIFDGIFECIGMYRATATQLATKLKRRTQVEHVCFEGCCFGGPLAAFCPNPPEFEVGDLGGKEVVPPLAWCVMGCGRAILPKALKSTRNWCLGKNSVRNKVATLSTTPLSAKRWE